jgi:antitoxin (DNA-binding transcriptional repressor) of toxin-antitoxin stability system
MRTITSLEAQNHFGELIDTSQREPVLITRRGRPVSVVFSPNGDTTNSIVQLMKLIREISPLKAEAAAKAFEEYVQRFAGDAEKLDITEEDITALVHANR